MLCNRLKTFKFRAEPRSPTIPCHGPAHFVALKALIVLKLCSFSTTFKWTAGRAPPNTVQHISRCWRYFCLDGMKHFKNMQSDGWAVLPQTRPNSLHIVEKLNRLDVMQPFQKHLSWWLGRAPQHPLSRPSSFRGVEERFRRDVMQTINDVQMNGWSCSPKHGTVHFTVLSQLFVWMAWNFSKTFKGTAGPCFPKHGRVLFTVLKNLFVWMLCSHLKTYKFMAEPASQHALSRPSSFRGVEEFFRLDVVQIFNNVQMNGWTCSPKKLSKFWLGRAPPNTAQFLSRCWKTFSSGYYAAI